MMEVGDGLQWVMDCSAGCWGWVVGAGGALQCWVLGVGFGGGCCEALMEVDDRDR